eukprot:753067-Hanusia_phi.AAC.10
MEGNEWEDEELESIEDLLALVEAERSKMSKAVLSSADSLSSAVTLARKRLAANIAVVEEQLKEEKRLLEESKAQRSQELNNSAYDELQAKFAQREAAFEKLKAEKRTIEEERNVLKSELEEARVQMQESAEKASYLLEENAALTAEVKMLRSLLKGNEEASGSSRSERHDSSSHDMNFLQSVSSRGAQEAREEAAISAQAEENPTRKGMKAMESILRKKKTDHGRFEDPWKIRLQCSLVDGVMECLHLNDKADTRERYTPSPSLGISSPVLRYDMKQWYVPPERRVPGKGKMDPLRFDLVHRDRGQVSFLMSFPGTLRRPRQVVSFKAETLESCDRWVTALHNAIGSS